MYLILVIFPKNSLSNYHNIIPALINKEYKTYTYRTDNEDIQIGDKVYGQYISNPVIIIDKWEVKEEEINKLFSFEVRELKIKQVNKYLPSKKCLDPKCSKHFSGFKSFI